MEISEGKKLTEVYERRIEGFFTKHSDLTKLDLIYDNVINEPQKWVEEIIEFLEFEPTEKQYSKAIEFVKPKEKIEKSRRIQKMRKIVIKPARLALQGIKEPTKIPGYLAKKIKGIFSNEV